MASSSLEKQFEEFDKTRNVQGIDYDKIQITALKCLQNKRNNYELITSIDPTDLLYMNRYAPSLIKLIETYPSDRIEEIEPTLKLLISNIKNVQLGKISQKECTNNIYKDQLKFHDLSKKKIKKGGN